MYHVEINLTEEYLQDNYPTQHDARRAAMEYLTDVLRSGRGGGARQLFRMGGKVKWDWAKDHIEISRVLDTWIYIDQGDELPEADTDCGTIVFILKKGGERVLGRFDADSEKFISDDDRSFGPHKVLAYMELSEFEVAEDEESDAEGEPEVNGVASHFDQAEQE